MPRTLLHLSLVALSALARAAAQPAVVGVGPTPPMLLVAPGQVTTLYLMGLNIPSAVTATNTPLPFELGGVSVTFHSAMNGVLDVPLFSVAPAYPGNVLYPAPPLYGPAGITAVTFQIPWEVYTGGGNFVTPSGTLTVSQDGASAAPISVLLGAASLRMIRACHNVATQGPAVTVCDPEFLHADGTLVSGSAPASPGEEIVFYLIGLGLPGSVPPVNGEPAASAIAMPNAATLTLSYNDNTNAQTGFGGGVIVPDYIGTTPGSIGLYQVNFHLPSAIPAGTPSCGAGTSTNVNVSIYAPGAVLTTTFDGGGLCLHF